MVLYRRCAKIGPYRCCEFRMFMDHEILSWKKKIAGKVRDNNATKGNVSEEDRVAE